MDFLAAPIITRKGPRCMLMQDVFVHGPRALHDKIRSMGRDVPGALHLANAFGYASVEEARHGFSLHTTPDFDRAAEPDTGTPYVRFGTPNHAELEAKLLFAHGLDNSSGYGCLTYASGMGAIFAALIAATRPGDEIIMDLPSHLYGCSGRLAKKMLTLFGRKVVFIDLQDTAEGQAALQNLITDKTRAIYCEVETNPYMKLNNIARIATIAHEVNTLEGRNPANKIRVVFDNTFLGPLFCRPLEIARAAVPADPA